LTELFNLTLGISLTEFSEIWKLVWSYLGPLLLLFFILYIRHPESFEKIIIHVAWVLSRISKRAEKNAIAREVKYLVRSGFTKYIAVEEIPEIVIEWGDEDKATMDVKAGRLVVVLKYGRRDRYKNIARALVASIPDLLAPEMKAVYDSKLLNCLSAHIARSIAGEYQPIVTAINEFIDALTEGDANLYRLAAMLVEIDDRSLLTRVLVPEMVEAAKTRYPHRDPSIDGEVWELAGLLQKLAKGEEVENPILYGKYIRVAFVLVARPEKIEAMLEPHVSFVKHKLEKYPGIRSIYVLAAGGKNVKAAKYLRMRLESEFKMMNVKLTVTEHVYEGKYKDIPRIKLYVARIKME